MQRMRPCVVSRTFVWVFTWGLEFGDTAGRVEEDAGRDDGFILKAMRTARKTARKMLSTMTRSLSEEGFQR